MAKRVVVSGTQFEAAKMIVERAQLRGEKASPSVVKIANASASGGFTVQGSATATPGSENGNSVTRSAPNGELASESRVGKLTRRVKKAS